MLGSIAQLLSVSLTAVGAASWELASLLAQATQSTARPGWAAFFESPLMPVFVIIMVLWIFMFRGKRRDDKKKKELINNLKRGDRIQTIGGVLGKVVEVEPSKVLLKVDESSNTKIWFSRNAVLTVLGEEKPEAVTK